MVGSAADSQTDQMRESVDNAPRVKAGLPRLKQPGICHWAYIGFKNESRDIKEETWQITTEPTLSYPSFARTDC